MFTEAMLRDSWQQLLGLAGDLRQVTGIHTSELQGHKIVFVTCDFKNMAIDVQTVLNDKGQISGLSFVPAKASTDTQESDEPPAYVDRSAFHEIEVTVGSGEWALPGTLSLPEGSGPFPCVVLVHGSGPNDRDETVGPNKTFRDLAWGLSSHGIAVLRYEKRTFAHKDKFTPELTSKFTVKEETIDDALEAVRLLRDNPGIDSKHIFVLGHSLGGGLAPRIGRQDPELAGLIIIAGMSRPMEDSILDQYIYIYSLSGPLTEKQKEHIETLKEQIARVKDPGLSEKVDPKDLPLGVPVSYWLGLRDYRPADVAKSLDMPILVLQAERDYQVPLATDFEVWKTALKDKSNATFKIFPKLNHLFIKGEGKSTPQEYGIKGHVDEAVIDTIALWIKNIMT